MLESDQDRLDVLQELGELVTIDGNEVWVIFDQQYLEALTDPGMSSAEPEVVGRTSDLKSVTQSTTIQRSNGDQYRVRENEPDGTGMTLLRLRSG